MKLLEYAGTGSSSLDSPEVTMGRWRIIREKPSLRRIYDEWYRDVARSIPRGDKPALEIGSGAGFMCQYIENLITSDILELPTIDRHVDACARFPFDDASLRGIAMVNTLHHLPDVSAFFGEGVRCLQPGGVISMIEPWNTRWSRLVYGKLHHEVFDPRATSWSFPTGGPLSRANAALPWIVFVRDQERFRQEFPDLRISLIRPIMPFRYLLSGGVSMRALVPSWSFGLLGILEDLSEPGMPSLAMFAHIVLTRRQGPTHR
ncbi:MAG: methyltransferase domain-containing protein [Alphaproteobacteria bacterium]|nr:methyltransferase domain-containing protein [Alphaproteobacteria bacterium]